MQSRLAGPILILLSALCFSVTGTLQALAPAGATPWVIAEVRMVTSAFFLFLSGFLGLGFGLVWKKMGREAEFPFGPALALSLLLMLCSPQVATAFWWLFKNIGH